MTFGYSTNAYTRFDLFEALAMIAAIGFRGVEIMCDQPHLYPPEWTNEDVAKLQETLKRFDLKVTNLNSFTLYAVGDILLPSWIEADPAQRQTRIDHTRSCLHLASALGCGNISIPPGGPAGQLSDGAALRRFREGLETVLGDAEALGVRLLIEPEPQLLIENSRQFLSFIKDFQSAAVGLNFDVGHFFCAGEDPAHSFEVLHPWVGHVHIEDIPPDRSHQHLIPGLGAVPFEGVVAAMARLGYRGDISLELYPYVDQPSKAGRAGREHLLPLLEAYNLL